TLWGKPVVTVYVRPNRHTYEYTEANEFFTLNFFTEDYRKALAVMGSKSGRDCDKDAEAGLTAVTAGESIAYQQAKTTLLCRKLYAADLDKAAIPQEILDTVYSPEPIHRMYIAEVVEIIES
ncbi:MAG: flavin reductase, partial [Lachnospiraceae bacterium]|nr:flavin reductase [Lachnospiraceae bacterium]